MEIVLHTYLLHSLLQPLLCKHGYSPIGSVTIAIDKLPL